MAKLANRCQETTATTGTGTLTLAGAVTGYVSFNDSFSNGDVVFYTIDDGLGNWEIGTGTVGTATLTRDAVIESSNSNALVNFASGSKRVFCTAPSRALLPDQTGNSGKVLSTNGTIPSWTTLTSGTVTSVSGTGTVSGITLSGTVTTSGNLTLGGTLDLSSPPAIGGTTPAAGAFTTLSSTGNTTLGDASADTLTINGTAVSIPNNLNFDSNTLFIDAANNAVGIGTTTIGNGGATSPSRLTLRKTAQSTVSDGSYIHIGATEAGVGTYQLITFGYNTGSLANSPAFIGYTNTNLSGNTFGDLIFGTRNVGTDTPATERLRIDSSGNLGLGVAPSAWDSNGNLTMKSGGTIFSNTGSLVIGSNAYYNAGWKYAANGYASNFNQGNGAFSWQIASNNTSGSGAGLTFTTAMTLDASGNLLVGTTNSGGGKFKVLAGTNIALGVAAATVVSGSITFNAINETNTANIPLDIRCSQLSCSSGVTPGAGTNALKYNSSTFAFTYDTSSARYKNNIRDSVYGLDDVLQLRSAMFEYKNDGRTDVGLIAEEVFDVIPELVPLDSEGRPDAVSYDRMVSVLVKAVQELHAEIELLKAKVN